MQAGSADDEGASDHLLRRAGAGVRRLPGREGHRADAAGGVRVLSGAGQEAGSAVGLRPADREEGVSAAVPPEEEAQDLRKRSIPEGDGGERRRREAGER